MPAAARNASGQTLHRFQPNTAAEQLVAAQTAHSGSIEDVEFCVGNVGRDDSDAAQPLRMTPQRFDKQPIVGAMHAHLHQHAALDAERAMHGEISLLRRRRRSIASLSRKGIMIGRADNMSMAIAGAARHAKVRRTRMRIWSLAWRCLQSGRGRLGHRSFLVGSVD